MHLSNSNFNKFKEKIPHTFTLLLDLKNCFGLINIDTLFKILNTNSILDSISPYIHLIYGNDSKLFFSLTNDRKILFTEGVARNGLHQGEIMASLAACLVLIEIIIISTTDFSISEKNSLTIVSIIDDMTIHASAEIMIKFITNFNKNLKILNTGIINLKKSFLLPPTESPSCPPLYEYQQLAKAISIAIEPTIDPINYIQVEMTTSLGIPHGNTNFKIEKMTNKAAELTRVFSRITQYPHTQTQYHLIKLCMSGTPTALIRQIRPSITIPHLVAKFHSDTMKWLQLTTSYSKSIPNPPLNELSILIAGTKCSEGGLNLPLDYQRIAPLAYLTTTISNAITLRTIYSDTQEPKHILLSLIDELLRTPNDPAEILLSNISPEKRDLILALTTFTRINKLPPNTTLENLTDLNEISQSMGSTALSKYNSLKILELLTTDLDKAQFVSQ